MSLNYESAAKKYVELRTEVERIDAVAKKETAEIKKIMLDIESWLTIKAQEEGLKTVPTPYGTAYWSTHYSAKAANPSAFKQFVIDNKAWDLIENRPAKLAIKSYVEAHGEPPAGVSFSAIRVFNLRANSPE